MEATRREGCRRVVSYSHCLLSLYVSRSTDKFRLKALDKCTGRLAKPIRIYSDGFLREVTLSNPEQKLFVIHAALPQMAVPLCLSLHRFTAVVCHVY